MINDNALLLIDVNCVLRDLSIDDAHSEMINHNQ